MALPLIWLGGATLGAVILADRREKRHQLEHQRSMGKAPSMPEGGQHVALKPSLWHPSHKQVQPQPGAIICCFVYGMIEHTGIWLDDHILIELHGSGLIRAVSTNRFLAGRTGTKIYIACSHDHQPLIDAGVLQRAEASIFQYREYDLFDNNCHRFVWSCLTGLEESLPSFNDLNLRLATHFRQQVYWDEVRL